MGRQRSLSSLIAITSLLSIAVVVVVAVLVLTQYFSGLIFVEPVAKDGSSSNNSNHGKILGPIDRSNNNDGSSISTIIISEGIADQASINYGKVHLQPEILTVVIGVNNTARWINNDFTGYHWITHFDNETNSDFAKATPLLASTMSSMENFHNSDYPNVLAPYEYFQYTFTEPGVYLYGIGYGADTGKIIVLGENDNSSYHKVNDGGNGARRAAGNKDNSGSWASVAIKGFDYKTIKTGQRVPSFTVEVAAGRNGGGDYDDDGKSCYKLSSSPSPVVYIGKLPATVSAQTPITPMGATYDFRIPVEGHLVANCTLLEDHGNNYYKTIWVANTSSFDSANKDNNNDNGNATSIILTDAGTYDIVADAGLRHPSIKRFDVVVAVK